MDDDDKLFPLPADAELREQAEALARAAWLMAAPDGSGDPPDTPDSPGDVRELRQGIQPAGARCPAKAAPFPLGGQAPPP
jgi:hypothetical protein